jgi:hypothetical protein
MTKDKWCKAFIYVSALGSFVFALQNPPFSNKKVRKVFDECMSVRQGITVKELEAMFGEPSINRYGLDGSVIVFGAGRYSDEYLRLYSEYIHVSLDSSGNVSEISCGEGANPWAKTVERASS